ncbi:MAG: hypothetical protein COZ77_02585 [Gallionellales bacterium CG_4_8_14_3_um_filter_54_18]|nr:MAG: hypothetical protein COZ77_02585 [Gallionellales bacterium CG_4_8_14_3_um_filter_54_18]
MSLKNRKITAIERVKSKALRVALNAFRKNPALGECQAKQLFTEIVSKLQQGMDEEAVVNFVIQSHAQPNQLSL